MVDEPQSDVTLLLDELQAGHEGAADRLFPLIYEELRRLARIHMNRERADHTLQPTALVHEAYARLVDQASPYQNRGHFLAIAATAMRRVLLDYARRRKAEKRGGNLDPVTLREDAAATIMDQHLDLIALDDALTRLSDVDPRSGKVVELRFFGGLSVEETAEVLDISPVTAKRDWRYARAWLKQALSA